MSGASLPNDAAIALPGAASAAVAWRDDRGQLYLTAIVKASFAFAADAEMPLAAPPEIVRGEVHHGDNPTRGVRFASDLAPSLGRADVVFTGHAHAPPGAPVTSLFARLALLGDRGRVLLDKRILVRDRYPFESMPLTYERAARGAGDWENPFGVDAAEANLLDPAQPARPAGFGPISRLWPARRRALGATPRRALEGPIAEIPAGFDWTYFQAAPPDQRIDPLRGDEWILLEGLHPTLPRIATRLPRVRGLARVHGLRGAGVPEGHLIDLVADTLHIDGEEQRCTVVWRRSLAIPHEGALATARIVAGVEIAAAPLAWFDPPRERQAAPAKPAVPGPPETLVITPEPPRDAQSTETVALMPGAGPRPGAVVPFRPARGGAAPPAREPAPASDAVSTGTLALRPAEQVAAREHRAMPFTAPAITHARDPGVGLERCAIIAVQLSERRAARAETLAAHGLSEGRWAEIEGRWAAAIERDDGARDAYDAAYLAEWERLRGGFGVAEYVRLQAAVERGELAAALDALGIRRTVWMRLRRIWSRRITNDRALAAAVDREVARQRRERPIQRA